MSKNIKDFAYLESHWLTRKIRGLNSNVKLRFKIKVLNGEEPIESVTAYLINTKRAQIGTIAKYSKLYLIENNYAIDESVNLRIDESFKLVIMFEHVNSKSDTTPLFEIEDISFGDPCNNPCYGLDKKIDETIKCERLVLEDDEMDFKCNCDEANGLFGKTCQKINYCLYKHLENEKNPDSKVNINTLFAFKKIYFAFVRSTEMNIANQKVNAIQKDSLVITNFYALASMIKASTLILKNESKL